MFRRGFFFRAIGAILLLVLMAVGAYAIHQAGVAQGYAIGLQTTGAEPGTLPENAPNYVMPVVPYRGYGWYGPGLHPFGFFGFIFPLFFGLMFFFLITRLIFRPMLWGWGGYHRHWRQYGEAPPWAKDWNKDEPKSGEKPDTKPEND